MKKIRKILYILSWIPFILLKIALALFGLIWVPTCLGTTNGDFSGMFWLWGNDEEGCPEWWFKYAWAGKAGKIAKRYPRFWWYAVRNPVNNFRYIFKDREAKYYGNWYSDKPMEAQQLLEANQSDAFLWAYNGPFAGYRCVWLKGSDKYSEIWFGWKVGSSVPGMGFTTQIRLNRKIGT